MTSRDDQAVSTRPPAELEDLARRINEEHQACDAAMRRGLQHALKAGELLIEAKSRCSYGTWATWIGANFEGSIRTAQAYMRLARELPRLEETKAQRVADLSFRDALKAIAEPTEDQMTKARLRALLARFEELEAELTEVLPEAPKLLRLEELPPPRPIEWDTAKRAYLLAQEIEQIGHAIKQAMPMPVSE